MKIPDAYNTIDTSSNVSETWLLRKTMESRSSVFEKKMLNQIYGASVSTIGIKKINNEESNKLF